MKKLLLSILLLGSMNFVRAEVASAESVDTFLDLVGAKNNATQAMNYMIAMYKQKMPDVPPEVWQEFNTEAMTTEIVAQIIPIYQKYLTQEEINQLITFYQSPVGQKLISKQPVILQESMNVGQQVGEKFAAQILEKYKDQLQQQK